MIYNAKNGQPVEITADPFKGCKGAIESIGIGDSRYHQVNVDGTRVIVHCSECKPVFEDKEGENVWE